LDEKDLFITDRTTSSSGKASHWSFRLPIRYNHLQNKSGEKES